MLFELFCIIIPVIQEIQINIQIVNLCLKYLTGAKMFINSLLQTCVVIYFQIQ